MTTLDLRRRAWLMLAYSCVGLGATGVIVPLLPTTPFLLLAVYAAGRSSPRLRWRLYRHRSYGPALRAWQRQRAIPARAKALAVALIGSSWLMLWLLDSAPALLLGLGLFFVALLAFILSRPAPRPTLHREPST
jgi:uncharacterized protein